jgi:hypothetical protein
VKLWLTLITLTIGALAFSACDRQKTVCSEESIGYIDDLASFPSLADSSELQPPGAPIMVEINGKLKAVNRIVSGPICNEIWGGTVYVGCDIQIAAWAEAPRFFEECDFTVEPGATVIVAPHNNEPFYRGCSCHTGEDLLE